MSILRPFLDHLHHARADRQNGIETRSVRQQNMDAQARVLAVSARRMRFAATCFMMLFVLLATKFYLVAHPEQQEALLARFGMEDRSDEEMVAQSQGQLIEAALKEAQDEGPVRSYRAPIYDRHGRILAANMPVKSLVLRREKLLFPEDTARKLSVIFPNRTEEAFYKDLTSGSKFKFLERRLSAEQQAAVLAIGDPGLSLGDREMRIYPNGRLAAHILGGTQFGREGETQAEILGRSGVEQYFDDFLRDPELAEMPLNLSIDLSVQAATEHVLFNGMRLTEAEAASAVLMDVHTGEIVAMAAMPDYDPNQPISFDPKIPPERQVMFNHAVQAVVELGSTFKIFTALQALEEGLVTTQTKIDTPKAIKVGRTKVSDMKFYSSQMSVENIIVKSSNVGSAKLAMMFGGDAQRAFMEKFGLFSTLSLELPEVKISKPYTMDAKQWRQPENYTRIAYGHSISTTPVHLAAAYAALGNGGFSVKPTLIAQSQPLQGARLVSEQHARTAVDLLHQVVERGTATAAQDTGYRIAGKTGSADKIGPDGKYVDDAVFAVFASVFPADDPKYSLVVTLDNPRVNALDEEKRTAGWTAVPVAQEIVARAAPLLGLRPASQTASPEDLVFTSANR